MANLLSWFIKRKKTKSKKKKKPVEDYSARGERLWWKSKGGKRNYYAAMIKPGKHSRKVL